MSMIANVYDGEDTIVYVYSKKHSLFFPLVFIQHMTLPAL